MTFKIKEGQLILLINMINQSIMRWILFPKLIQQHKLHKDYQSDNLPQEMRLTIVTIGVWR
jgi:hypothetical protein